VHITLASSIEPVLPSFLRFSLSNERTAAVSLRSASSCIYVVKMHKIVLYIIICTKICICRSQCAHDSKMRCISKSCTRNLQIYYLTPACTLANWKRNSNHSRTAHFSNCTDSQIARNIMHVVIVIHIRVCSGSKSLTQLWSVIRPSEIVLGGMWGLADLKIPMHVHFFRRAIFTHKVRQTDLVFSDQVH